MKTLKTLIPCEKNWIKGFDQREIGHGEYAYCLRGALKEAYYPDVYPNASYSNAKEKLMKAIGKVQKKAWSNVSITYFNDAPTTTFEKIKKVIEIANI